MTKPMVGETESRSFDSPKQHRARALTRFAGVAIGVLALLAHAAPTPASAGASVRNDGVILVDAEPFFPLGIYHDGLDDGYYGDLFVSDIRTIAEAGFNFIHVSMDFTYDGDTPDQSTAARVARYAEAKHVRLGMAVYLKNLPLVVAEQAKWPAILMASLGDDFNSDDQGQMKGPPKYAPEKLRELHAQVKQIAPRLLTYSSGSSHFNASLQGYEQGVDCLAVQCYPIGDGSQSVHNELEAMDDVTANYWRLAGPAANKALIVNLQSFAWGSGRWPQPEEARLQAWITLLNGARGLVWYSFLSSKKPLPTANPALWAELRQLLSELKQIVPFVTDGRFTRFANAGDPHFADAQGTWHAGYWTYDNRRLIVAVNTHRTETIELNAPLAGEGDLHPLFDTQRYGTGLRWGQDRIQGKLLPGSIQIYCNTISQK